MSAKFSRISVFLGALLANFMMTFLTCFVGYATHLILPVKLTLAISILLLFFFSFKLFRSAIRAKKSEPDSSDEEE